MTKATIYHNPRCSKSRQTLALLEEQGVDIEVVHYLENPPSQSALKKILQLLDLKPRELMRRNESVYKDNALDNDALSDKDLIAAMLTHPILIERPIVVINDKAAIGRPPECVLELL